MSYFNITDNEGLRTVQFIHGKANTINEPFLAGLRTLLKESYKDDGILGIHMTGQSNFFSAGLDIVELFDYDAAQFERFWKLFMKTIYDLAAFDKPIVAAVTGHAPAGGCILAMTADHRVMAEGNYRIGLNEVPVGIIVPPAIFHLYAFWIGRRRAVQYLLEGSLHTVSEALRIGLVDETTPPERVDSLALQKLARYTSFHQGAWRQTKKNCRSELLPLLEVRKDQYFKQSLQQWWKPEVREMLQAFIDRLKK